ncbi:MAG: hypothetical protein MJZ66_09815 [Bacteroidales bacterium]|nr:hypothetical protein [Bacteroidales bacterium]
MKILLDEFDSRRMERLASTIETNSAMAEALSLYVNTNPKYVTIKQIQEFVDEYEMPAEMAYSMILSTALGFDIHKNNVHQELYQDYILPAINPLRKEDFYNFPSIRNLRISGRKIGSMELTLRQIEACEALYYDDCHTTSEFREFQKIGFFMEPLEYPAISENGKIVAALDPLTISTTQTAIENAHGRVLMLGLGIGFLAAESATKKSVEKITILEKSCDLIEIFKSEILPQINGAHKIEIINADPLCYVEKAASPLPYDYIFSDTDDLRTFLKLRNLGCEFSREKKLISELRKTVFEQLYRIFKNPTEGGKEIKTYREVADMLSDKELREVKVKM